MAYNGYLRPAGGGNPGAARSGLPSLQPRRPAWGAAGRCEVREARRVTWQTGDGRAVVVTVGLDVPASLAGNLRTADQTPERVVRVDVTLAGKPVSHAGLEPVEGHRAVVARLGKVGLVPANLERVCAAIAEVEATEEYQASERMWASWSVDRARYEAERAEVERAMRGGE